MGQARQFSMLVWVCVLGTNGSLLPGCWFSGAKPPQDPVVNEEQTGLPHPKNSTAWAVQALLAASQLPPASILQECRDRILSIGKEASNEGSLMQSARSLEALTMAAPERFHWCFYASVVELDANLERIGVSQDQRAEMFFVHMQGLWPLAMALDRHFKVTTYFSYLRSRYLQISKDYFARDLDVFGNPIIQESEKPAGRFVDQPKEDPVSVESSPSQPVEIESTAPNPEGG